MKFFLSCQTIIHTDVCLLFIQYVFVYSFKKEKKRLSDNNVSALFINYSGIVTFSARNKILQPKRNLKFRELHNLPALIFFFTLSHIPLRFFQFLYMN